MDVYYEESTGQTYHSSKKKLVIGGTVLYDIAMGIS